MALSMLLAVAAAAAPVEGPALGQAASASAAGRLGASSAAPEEASARAKAAFGETAAAPVRLANARFSAAPPAKTGPAPLYAAAEAPPTPAGAKVYADDDEGGGGGLGPIGKGWDRSGTLTTGAFGLGLAVVGFMLGGPIGAAAAFLVGFFIGAAVWKAYG